MTNGEIIEQLENAIELIKQDGKDWLDDRDIPLLEVCIKSLTALDKIRAEIERYRSTIDKAISEDELKIEGMKEAYADCLEIIDKHLETKGLVKVSQGFKQGLVKTESDGV